MVIRLVDGEWEHGGYLECMLNHANKTFLSLCPYWYTTTDLFMVGIWSVFECAYLFHFEFPFRNGMF
jgi:hypothetical protein